MAGNRLAQAPHPVKQQRIAQADLAAEVEQVAEAVRQRQVASRRIPGLHQLAGVAEEVLAVGGQARARAVAHEQPAAELPFEVLDARGDGGLGQVQAFRGSDEATAAGDLQEGTGEVDIHAKRSAATGGPPF